MNVSKSISMLSVAAAVAAALPAYAQRTADDGRFARHHNHTVVRSAPARHVTVVRRPVVVQRTVVVQRPVTVVRPAYVARPAYSYAYRPTYVNGYRSYANYWNDWYYWNYYRSYWAYYRNYWTYYWNYWS